MDDPTTKVLPMKKKRVRMAECADLIADTIGMRFDKQTAKVFDPPTIVGPLGMSVHTRMKFSHGTQQHEYLAVCWKVSGHLYMAVCCQPDEQRVTVVLLDKKRYTAKHPSRTNLAEVCNAADKKDLIGTVDDYVKLWEGGVIGVWTRYALDPWDGGVLGKSDNLDGRQS